MEDGCLYVNPNPIAEKNNLEEDNLTSINIGNAWNDIQLLAFEDLYNKEGEIVFNKHIS